MSDNKNVRITNWGDAPRTTVSGGIGFDGLLTILFIAFKLLGIIDWPWIWVLAPLWIGIAIVIVLVAILIIVAITVSD